MTHLKEWLRSLRGEKRKSLRRAQSKPKLSSADHWEMSAKEALLVKTLGSKNPPAP